MGVFILHPISSTVSAAVMVFFMSFPFLSFLLIVCGDVVATLVVGYGGDVAVGAAGEFEFAVLSGEVEELVAEGGDL